MVIFGLIEACRHRLELLGEEVWYALTRQFSSPNLAALHFIGARGNIWIPSIIALICGAFLLTKPMMLIDAVNPVNLRGRLCTRKVQRKFPSTPLEVVDTVLPYVIIGSRSYPRCVERMLNTEGYLLEIFLAIRALAHVR